MCVCERKTSFRKIHALTLFPIKFELPHETNCHEHLAKFHAGNLHNEPAQYERSVLFQDIFHCCVFGLVDCSLIFQCNMLKGEQKSEE